MGADHILQCGASQTRSRVRPLAHARLWRGPGAICRHLGKQRHAGQSNCSETGQQPRNPHSGEIIFRVATANMDGIETMKQVVDGRMTQEHPLVV